MKYLQAHPDKVEEIVEAAMQALLDALKKRNAEVLLKGGPMKAGEDPRPDQSKDGGKKYPDPPEAVPGARRTGTKDDPTKDRK